MDSKIVIKRNAGVDLLKIILALMVIGIHFDAPATGHASSTVTWLPSKLFLYSIFSMEFPAVNTYVFICGFFSYCQCKNINSVIRSLVKLWLCVITFSMLGIGVGWLYTKAVPTAPYLISHILPICSSLWWFLTSYFVLMLLSPIINSIIKKSTFKQDLVFLFISLFLFSIVPVFMRYEDKIGHNLGYGLIWFVILYTSGAYLFKYLENSATRRLFFRRSFFKYIICSFIFLSINFLCSKIAFLNGYGLLGYNNIVSWFQTVFLFTTFYKINWHIISNRVISKLATLSMASYVFHCQPDISDVIWNTIEPSRFSNTIVIIPLFFGTVIGLYVISIILEYIRVKLYAKWKPEVIFESLFIRINNKVNLYVNQFAK